MSFISHSRNSKELCPKAKMARSTSAMCTTVSNRGLLFVLCQFGPFDKKSRIVIDVMKLIQIACKIREFVY
jgi:hypothetical protein